MKLATGTPVPTALCSRTGTNGVVSSAPGGVWPPQLLTYCEKPASSSRRLVTGDDQLACVIFSRSSHMWAASGAQVPNAPTATQSSPRLRHPPLSFVNAPPWQSFW